MTGLEGGDRQAAVVGNALDIERCDTLPLAGEGGVGSHHFLNRYIADTQAQRHYRIQLIA